LSTLYLLRLFASFCELLGVFFLSVEAIKLENFRRLRDRVIKPFYGWINPTLEIVHGEDSPKQKIPLAKKISDFFRDPILQEFVALTVVGAIVVEIVAYVSGIGYAEFILHLGFPEALVYVVALLFGDLVVGILVYSAFVGVVQLIMASLDFLDTHTQNGSIGILGFILFFIAFVINNYVEFLVTK